MHTNPEIEKLLQTISIRLFTLLWNIMMFYGIGLEEREQKTEKSLYDLPG